MRTPSPRSRREAASWEGLAIGSQLLQTLVLALLGETPVEVSVSTEPALTVGSVRVELVELFARSLEAKAG